MLAYFIKINFFLNSGNDIFDVKKYLIKKILILKRNNAGKGRKLILNVTVLVIENAYFLHIF